jgi:histidine ammonia-lyase/tyrosine ammonia-lyase
VTAKIESSKEAITVNGEGLRTADVAAIASAAAMPQVSEPVMDRVRESRAAFEAIAEKNTPIYGVTTGFGELVHNWVDIDHERALQENLLRSHCAGVGPSFGVEEVRAMMVARLNSLVRGYSAVRPKVVQQLLKYLAAGVTPIVPEIGSLGASGDLAPLSHIAITLMGEGYVRGENGESVPTEQVLLQKDISPIVLKYKEGLSLINGTSAMTGLGSLLVERFSRQTAQAEIITALSLEALRASTGAYMPSGHDVAKPHPGQIQCAANIRRLVEGTSLMAVHEDLTAEMKARAGDEKNTGTGVFIQKAYTLRCVPQMLGAIRDTLSHCRRVVEVELNSSNDNPLFFDNEEVFHGGNFHGQQVAFAMDFLAIAATQLGVVSERRLNRFLNPYLNNDLPEFLASKNAGLSCGFAGAQYPATALIAENRTICSPASIQSVPSNGDNQDVVSMGLIAARNARRIVDNNSYIMAVELLAACQAIDLSDAKAGLSTAGAAVYDLVRGQVPMLSSDRHMSEEIEWAARAIREGQLLNAVSFAGIQLET